MPKINGFDVLRTIRDMKILTPVLMLTVKDSDEDIISGTPQVRFLSGTPKKDSVHKIVRSLFWILHFLVSRPDLNASYNACNLGP